jgi:hypothetical protein
MPELMGHFAVVWLSVKGIDSNNIDVVGLE